MHIIYILLNTQCFFNRVLEFFLRGDRRTRQEESKNKITNKKQVFQLYDTKRTKIKAQSDKTDHVKYSLPGSTKFAMIIRTFSVTILLNLRFYSNFCK